MYAYAFELLVFGASLTSDFCYFRRMRVMNFITKIRVAFFGRK